MHPRPAAAIALAIAAVTAPVRADDPPATAADVASARGRFERIEHTPIGDAPTRGPRGAPVTLEVYFSAGSELGNQAYRRAMNLWRKHPARIRLVFWPLRRSDTAEYVAPVVIAAHARGRFFALMDELAGRVGPQVTAEALTDVAVRVGIDHAVAATAVTDATIAAILDANNRRAVRARVGQRADLVINGRPLGPTPDDNTLETTYQSALTLARVELAAGAPAAALPALAARRQRCFEARERLRPRRRIDDAVADDDDDADRTAPVAGWHLGTLLRDGTGCPPEPPPNGRVDQAFDYERAHQAPGALLLSAPLADDALPTCGPAQARVVIHVVCNLRNPTCADQVERARKVAVDYFPAVRVVYRPWADLDEEDASIALAVGEAVMCSQRLGDGWGFVLKLRGQGLDDDRVARAAVGAGIDREAFMACAGAQPDAARQAIRDARAAGVVWAPTVVVGQRAYVGGLTDDRWLRDLVDAELAPGLLGGVADAGAGFASTASGNLNSCMPSAPRP